MTNFKFIKNCGCYNTEFEIIDKYSAIVIDNIPECYFKTAQRFGKIDVHYDTKQIDFYLRDGIGAGLICKFYRVYKRDQRIIIEPSGKITFKIEMGQAIPDCKAYTIDMLFCSWLYRQVFKEEE